MLSVRSASAAAPRQDDGPTGGQDYNAALDIRTIAGPSSVVQWVFIAGPNTVSSQVQHIHVVCPPP